jgi:hypothetical protein
MLFVEFKSIDDDYFLFQVDKKLPPKLDFKYEGRCVFCNQQKELVVSCDCNQVIYCSEYCQSKDFDDHWTKC